MMLRRTAAAAFAGLAIALAGVLALADPPRQGFPADPPARAAEKQWVFEVAYDKGARSVTSARSATAKKPIPTPRKMGRFALELWVGHELLDRVRFDVPLLGDEQERDPKRPSRRPSFHRVTTKVKVQMADHPRATVLAFVDRATGESLRYFWPPDENGQLTRFSAKAATAQADGGARDASPGDAAASDGAATLPGDAAAASDAGPARADAPPEKDGGSSNTKSDASADAARD